MNKKLLALTIILLFGAVIATSISLQSVKNSTKHHIDKPHNPDAYAINLHYTQLDTNGKVKNIIHTPKLLHYPFENSADFETPDITIINPKAKPWHITAQRGHSVQGTKIVTLIDQVKMHQNASHNNKEMTITTSRATIDLHNKYISTDQFVTIMQPGITTTAIGANADLDKKIVNLLSNVHEIYDPKKYTN
ncbi:MAG: LPS export ABC transporter periplasmic protein LptC [Gammaproteobacteria bacterium]|nr:LPS export ABC transporter periplasmic protein LptC [Gammaproteobacteria bacterium]